MILRTYLRFLKNVFRRARFLDTLSRYVQDMDTFRPRWWANKSAIYTLLPKNVREVLPTPEKLQAELERADREDEE